MIIEKLTDNEAKIIKSTWSKLMADPKQTGVTLFINLFKAHPEYKNLFRKLEKIPMESLGNARQMKAHGTVVMNALNGIVQSVDDPDCLEELLINNGATHARFGLTPRHYKDLWDVFIDTCREAFGTEFGTEEEKVWRRVFSQMEPYIFAGLAREGAEDDE